MGNERVGGQNNLLYDKIRASNDRLTSFATESSFPSNFQGLTASLKAQSDRMMEDTGGLPKRETNSNAAVTSVVLDADCFCVYDVTSTPPSWSVVYCLVNSVVDSSIIMGE